MSGQLTDVAGLTLALVAATLSTRPATDTHTWGYRRGEVLAAAAPAAVLFAVCGLVFRIRRLEMGYHSIRHCVNP